MAIRVPRTTMGQEPQGPSMASGSAVAPAAQIGNPAAALARPVDQASRLAESIYREERDREIETRVRELDVERRRTDGGVLDSYLQALGKNAVDGRADAMAAIAENSKRVRAGITDRAVADAWAAQDAALTNAAFQQVDGHYRRQNIQWQADTHEARVETLVSDLERVAFGEGFNPATGRLSDEADRARSAYRNEIQQMGRLLGWGDDVTANAVRKADSNAHAIVVDGLVGQGRAGEAAAYLAKRRGEIDGKTLSKLEETVRLAGVSDRSLRLSRDVLARVGQEQQKAIRDRAEATGQRQSLRPNLSQLLVAASDDLQSRFAAGEIDAAMVDATMARVTQALKIEGARQAEADRTVLQTAEKTLRDNPNLSWVDLPAQLRQSLDSSGQLQTIVDFQRNGHQYVTNPRAKAAVLSLSDAQLATINPGELFLELRPVLDDQDMERVLARQRAVTGKATKDDLRVVSTSRIVETYAKRKGIVPWTGGWSDQQSQDFADLEQRIQDRVDLEGIEKPSDLEKLLQIEESNTLSVDGDPRPVISMTAAQHEVAGAYVGSEFVRLVEVPQEAQEGLRRLARQSGIAIDDSMVIAAWAAGGRPKTSAEIAAFLSSPVNAVPAITPATVTPPAQRARTDWFGGGELWVGGG